jgi:hypothetical protein
MGHRRGKLESWQCGPVGCHILTTLQGNNCQNEPQHQQGVMRPQLILAIVSAEILQMRLTLPSSRCTKLTLMLVKWLSLWWRELFCRFIVSRQIAGNECWEVVVCLFLFQFGESSKKMVPIRKKNKWREVFYWTHYHGY